MRRVNARKLTRQYVFQRVYDIAAMVEASVDDDESFHELPWEDDTFRRSVATFSKVTVLHHYIYTMIAVETRYDYRKRADIYEEAPELIAEIEDTLRAYGIDYQPYADYQRTISADDAKTREEYPFHQWFLTQEERFEELWEKLTDEVFHLLFSNRAFLLRFNIALAKWVTAHNIQFPADLVTKKGLLKRVAIPKWVRDAVFFRDHGRCLFCQVDLSGLLATDRLDHFDHMVPLAGGGINDPTNVQLLCEACNLRKSAGKPRTGLRYPAWWPE